MNGILKIRGVIFGSLYPNKIHIHVGFGTGMIDGGYLLMIDTKIIPKDCRMPNTLVWVFSKEFGYNVVKIEKMSYSEAQENKIVPY